MIKFKNYKIILSWIKNNRIKIYIIFLGLTPLFWFRQGMFFAGGDDAFLINPTGNLSYITYMWYSLEGAGFLAPSMCGIIPTRVFFFVFQQIGLSIESVQKIYFVLFFIFTGFSINYLISAIFNNRKNYVIRIVAVTFYLFNLLLVTYSPKYRLYYTVLPLLLALWIKGLHKCKESIKYAVLFALSSVLITSVNSNPSFATTIGICLFLYFLYFIFIEKNNFSSSIKFISFTVLLTALINIWWFFPYLFYVKNTFVPHGGKDIYSVIRGGADILRVIRLMSSHWGRYPTIYPYQNIYLNPFLTVLTFVLPFLAFSSLLFKQRKICLFFAFLSIIGIFFAKGPSGPFGFVFKWSLAHLPGFWIYRNPWARFIALVALSYSVMIAVATKEIYNFLKNYNFKNKKKFLLKKIPTIFLILIISVIFLVAWPLFKGTCILRESEAKPGFYVKVPDYWLQSSEWIKNQNKGDFRILVMPRSLPYTIYQWPSGYWGVDIVPYMIPNPVIMDIPLLKKVSGILYSANMIEYIYETIEKTSSIYMPKLLGLMNIKYIMQRNDFGWEFNRTLSPEKINYILSKQKNIRFLKKVGQLDFYQVEDKYYLPHIYTAVTPMFVDSDTEALISLIETNHLDEAPALFFNMQKENIGLRKRRDVPKLVLFQDEWQLLEPDISSKPPGIAGKPQITFKKINPTKYLVNVRGAEGPFWLIFSESFQKQWRAYVEKSKIGYQIPEIKVGSFSEIIAEYPELGVKEARHLQKFTPQDIKYLFRKEDIKEHYLVNGYANAWYINPKELGLEKDFIITLYFWPQVFFYLGLIISSVTLIGFMVYLGCRILKR